MTDFNLLMALSYARTALDDPGGLPAAEAKRIMDGSPYSILDAGRNDRSYVIDRIDEVMGALDYNGGSGNDNRNEARWVAFNLARLCETFEDEMEIEAAYEDHDDESREAYTEAARLASEAGTLLLTAASRLEK